MAITRNIDRGGETRTITINGNVGAEFELYVKQGSKYYNFDTDSFQAVEKILKFQKIPSSGVYTKEIVIPAVTADTSYDFYMKSLPGTNSTVSTTNEQKIGTLFQKSVKTATFTATESASTLVVQNSGSAGTDLTGGTLSNTRTELTQTGTITEDSSLFVYCHSVPSWDRATGGDWTLANTVDAKVLDVSGAIVKLVSGDGTNIAASDSVTGASITDEITVSSISGDAVTLSAAQNIKPGEILTFSKSAWEIGPLRAEVSDTSGTNTITMSTYHNITKMGIANITCVLNCDNHFSVKPNAFPVEDIKCPAGAEVIIYPIVDCTNYLGTKGDLDNNVASKTYKIHSVPADGTSSRPEEAEDGTITYVDLSIQGSVDVSAGAAMGSAGAAAVTYTAHANMIAGDKDYFYYKTTDAQSTPVTSSTTQGKISITIV